MRSTPATKWLDATSWWVMTSPFTTRENSSVAVYRTEPETKSSTCRWVSAGNIAGQKCDRARLTACAATSRENPLPTTRPRYAPCGVSRSTGRRNDQRSPTVRRRPWAPGNAWEEPVPGLPGRAQESLGNAVISQALGRALEGKHCLENR